MTTSDFIAAVESGELDQKSTATMDSAPYFRVCRNNNYQTSKCFQMNDLKEFIHTRNGIAIIGKPNETNSVPTHPLRDVNIVKGSAPRVTPLKNVSRNRDKTLTSLNRHTDVGI